MGREARVARTAPKTEKKYRNVREFAWSTADVRKALLPKPKKQKNLSIVKLDK